MLRKTLWGLILLLAAAPGWGATLSGTVFEDVNYGGGAGRGFGTAGTVGVASARVEVYNQATGVFVAATATAGGGAWSLVVADNATYQVRVVSSSVPSSRTGYTTACLPIQTFRTDANTGTAANVFDRVGGEDPAKPDAAENTTSADYTTVNAAATPIQSVTVAAVTTTNITGLDFGFNFSTVVNKNDAGQGSLRQFVTNSNALGGEGSLAQSGLAAGFETSVFMISDGLAHAGLRAGLTNQLTGGVAVISVSSLALPAITGTKTVVDATTQTANVGNTNNVTLGAGGAGQTFDKVGTGADGVAGTADDVDLSTLNGPEVEIKDGGGFAIGLHVQNNNITLRGISIYGFGSINENGNIVIDNTYTGARIEECVVGASATSFTSPTTLPNGGSNIVSSGADNGTIQNNLVGFSGDGSGIRLTAASNNWTVENNEVRNNNLVNPQYDGIALPYNSANNTVRGNLIIGNKGMGLDTFNTTGSHTIADNTVTGNGVAANTTEVHGVRLEGTGSLVARNLIYQNYGSGIAVSPASTGNTLSKNSIWGNGTITNDVGAGPAGQIGIDLSASSTAGDGVTRNDSGDTDTGGNNRLNYPVLSTATITGATLTVSGWARPGSQIELFVAEATPDPSGFGEGQTFLTTLTENGGSDLDPDTGTYGPANINGLSQGTDTTNRFRFTIALPSGVNVGTLLTSTATAGNNTSEFGGNVAVTSPSAVTLSGTVFEDKNYGGGAGRDLATAAGVGRPGARVELYNNTGNFLLSTTTDAGGAYTFSVADNQTYTLRVANRTVSSARPGYLASQCLGVQTFRIDGSGGSALAVTNRVGGEAPEKADAGSNTTSATLASLTTASQTPQSIASVAVGAANIAGLDFGFNFSTIVNTFENGVLDPRQGSLRQFLRNANNLGDKAALAQAGLLAGVETSVFMISDGLAHPGLRAGLVNQLSGDGVAVITFVSNIRIDQPNVALDATTQTANVGDTNAGTLGAGGTVGVGADGVAGTGDELALSPVNRPEVQIADTADLENGIHINANNVSIKGIAIYGFGNATDALVANIYINPIVTAGTRIEACVIGTTATSFTDPGAAARTKGSGVYTDGADNGTIQNNLLGFCNLGGVLLDSGSNGWTVQNNEIRGNALASSSRDGINLNNGNTATIRGNLLVGTQGLGIDLPGEHNATHVVEHNTVQNNGIGGTETHGIRVYSSNNTLRYNQVNGNIGAGIVVTSGATGNTLSKNSVYNNGGIGIDLSTASTTGDGLTLNDNGDGDTGGNNRLNFPVLQNAVITGANLEITGYARAGSTIELFVAEDPADTTGFGEGRTYLKKLVDEDTTGATGDAPDTLTTLNAPYASPVAGRTVGSDTTASRFRFTVALASLPGGVTLTAGTSQLTATATLGTNTSEFGNNIPVTNGQSVSGTIFDDPNYGGGAARPYATANASAVASGFAADVIRTAIDNARVELYDAGGNFYASVLTTDGLYSLTNLAPGNWRVRVASRTVRSARAGYTASCLPVLTFRTDATSGSAVGVTDYVGGEDRGREDVGSNTTSVTYDTFNTAGSSRIQVVTTVALGNSDITGIDFGFNFSTVINTRGTGQGGVAQFIINSNALGNETLLAQSGFRKNSSNADEALPPDKETSIFMIPDSQAHPGSRPTTGSFLNASGVAAISYSVTQLISGNNTILDGTTQTVNIGDTNAGQLGAGGTVGVGADGIAGTGDERALSQVYRPEIQIRGPVNVAGNNESFEIDADNVTFRGLALYGTTSTTGSSGDEIQFNNPSSGGLVEQCILGATATSFTDPGAGARTPGTAITLDGADSGIIRNNLIGFVGNSGIQMSASSDGSGANGWLVENNEFRDNGKVVATSDGIDAQCSRNNTIRGNLLTGSSGTGMDMSLNAGPPVPSVPSNNIIEHNTITGNGSGNQQTCGVRLFGTNNTVQYNHIHTNTGAGVLVTYNPAATPANNSRGHKITKNSIHSNGSIAVDLLVAANNQGTGTAPYTTLNDTGDADSGANNLVNFPVLETAALSAGTVTLSGYSLPGTDIEVFVADRTGAAFGQGKTFLGTFTEGSGADLDAGTGTYTNPVNGLNQGADNNATTVKRFSFTFALPAGADAGSTLVATATVTATTVTALGAAVTLNSTSEFGGNVTILSNDPDLSVTKTHSGNFTRNQNGAYTITVTNSSSSATTAAVTVEDTLPAGLSYVSSLGTGWAAPTVAGQIVTWTRADVLAAGGAFPALTLTVNVSAALPGTTTSVTNAAAVSGGGETNTGNNTASDPTLINTPLLLLVRRITALNGTSFTGFVDDAGDPNDNHARWPAPPTTYLRGVLSVASAQPGDVIEHTVYFLSCGTAAAASVTICDLLPAYASFVPDSYTSIAGNLSGVALALNAAALPTVPNLFLTNTGDADRGRFYPAGAEAPPAANAPVFAAPLPGVSNLNGVVGVDVVTGATLLPLATGAGVPFNSYGFVRFRVRVN